MRIEPRRQLLETWAATVRSSWRGGVWHWGGRDGSNSIADAEQLLCILLPATRVQPLALDRPDSTSEGARTALAPLGDANDIPVALVRIATQYFERYAGPDGHPVFAGGSYFGGDDLHDWQREREVVDSFAVGLTLSLTVLSFLRIFQSSVRRAMLQEEVRRLERLARARLTAAMVGLLRSFSTDVFDADSEPGQTLIATVNRNGRPARQVVSELRTALRETIASFDEVLIGSGQTVDLGPGSRLFACGWSWGVVADAPQVYLEDTADIGWQQQGFAQDRPHLYFTVAALDAIEDLFSERTRLLGLLDEEQHRLARALQLRWDLAVSYWSIVATFTDGWEWPLEDRRDDYHTLLLSSILVKDLTRMRRPAPELARVGKVLAGLADNLRLTPATQPSQVLRLVDHGPESWEEREAAWAAGEFAPLLLHNNMVVAGQLRDGKPRTRTLRLADHVWDHLEGRRRGPDAVPGLWDEPAEHGPSWRYTLRVVEGLVTAANLFDAPGNNGRAR